MSADIVERLPEPDPLDKALSAFATACVYGTHTERINAAAAVHAAARAYAAEAVRTALAERAAVPAQVVDALRAAYAALACLGGDSAVTSRLWNKARANAALEGLRQAIAALTAQPAAAPESAQAVAWIDPQSIAWLRVNPEHRVLHTELRGVPVPKWTPLYTHPAPARVAVALTPAQALAAWAERHHVHFVSRSYGQYTYNTVSREALLELAANGLTAPEDGGDRQNA